MLSLLFVIGGLALVILAMWDVFAMMLLPRTISFLRLSTVFYHITWRFWTLSSSWIGDSRRRQNWLAIYGPFSVIMQLVVWGLMCIFGYAMLHKGLHTSLTPFTASLSFENFLYLSGDTLFTLGMGNVSPQNRLGKLLVIIEAANGLALLAIIIGYMPLLEQSFFTREVGVALFESRGGSPQCAYNFLKGYQEKKAESVELTLREAEGWVAQLLQSHLSHPVLAYYRSQHIRQSWIISMAALLDSCALLMVGTNSENQAQAKATFQMAQEAIKELCWALSASSRNKFKERLDTETFKKLAAVLAKINFPLPSGKEAEEKLKGLRLDYEPYLLGIATKLKVDLPPWLPSD